MSLKRKNIFRIFFVSAVMVLAGCQAIPLKQGVSAAGEKIYLSDASELPKAIDSFSKSQDLTNEESKINYLIARVQKSKVGFVRNRAHYTSMEAAEFLRWKLDRPRWRPLVHSARDFVNIITKGSVTSGEPYRIILANGDHHDLKAIMVNELGFLEEYLKNPSPPHALS